MEISKVNECLRLSLWTDEFLLWAPNPADMSDVTDRRSHGLQSIGGMVDRELWISWVCVYVCVRVCADKEKLRMRLQMESAAWGEGRTETKEDGK